MSRQGKGTSYKNDGAKGTWMITKEETEAHGLGKLTAWMIQTSTAKAKWEQTSEGRTGNDSHFSARLPKRELALTVDCGRIRDHGERMVSMKETQLHTNEGVPPRQRITNRT